MVDCCDTGVIYANYIPITTGTIVMEYLRSIEPRKSFIELIHKFL